MTFNNPFFLTALIVLGTLIIAGIITIIIMKIKKAPENARAIAGVSTVFAALILSGMLVYLVSTSMMYDLMNKKTYKPFELSNSDKTKSITIKEFSSANSTGFEVYNDKDVLLGEITTESFLPFTDEEYELDWKDNEVTIYFTFKKDDDTYICRYCKADLDKGTLSDAADADKDLSKKKDESSADKSSS